MKKYLIVGGAVAALTASSFMPASAQTALIDNPSYYNFLYMATTVHDVYGSLPTDGIASLSENYVDNNFQSSVSFLASGNPNGHAIMNLELDSFSPSDSSDGGEYVFASDNLTYAVEVVETGVLPLGVSVATVPVITQINGEASAEGFTSSSQVSVISTALDLDAIANASCSNMVCTEPGDFSEAISTDILADAPLYLTVQASGSAFVGNEDTSGAEVISGFQGLADPTITIDPSFEYSNDFSIIVSPYVGNLSAVPEPATWAMFLIGFGAVGSMMRGSRRKQLDAATAA